MSSPKIITVILFCATLISCKKPYTPEAVTAPNNYLVVEGIINVGDDSTHIKLSRTVNLSSGVTTNPETNAILTIENDQDLSFPLSEISKGTYATSVLHLDISRKYRLRIKTSKQQEYLSDFVQAKLTPPIDSIGYSQTAGGIQLYANTHDSNNQTHYYRWEYDETWQFNSKFQSLYISNGTEIVPRTAAQDIYSCFGNSSSSTILLGSSAKLSEDVIYRAPLTQILSTSEKIGIKYSILLRQYALSTEAYNFWINLKKNTEQLGSIFDAQPSNINGNIHNTVDPAEPVIGYISATSIQTKRIFLTKEQLPVNWLVDYPYSCTADSILFVDASGKSVTYPVKEILVPLPNRYIPIRQFSVDGATAFAGFLASSIQCVDCTLRGTKTRPVFWK